MRDITENKALVLHGAKDLRLVSCIFHPPETGFEISILRLWMPPQEPLPLLFLYSFLFLRSSRKTVLPRNHVLVRSKYPFALQGCVAQMCIITTTAAMGHLSSAPRSFWVTNQPASLPPSPNFQHQTALPIRSLNRLRRV
jgi:hypothetical protein